MQFVFANHGLDTARRELRRGSEARPVEPQGFVDALAEFETALQLNPNFSLAQRYHGLALCYCGRWQEATAPCLAGLDRQADADRARRRDAALSGRLSPRRAGLMYRARLLS